MGSHVIASLHMTQTHARWAATEPPGKSMEARASKEGTALVTTHSPRDSQKQASPYQASIFRGQVRSLRGPALRVCGF